MEQMLRHLGQSSGIQGGVRIGTPGCSMMGAVVGPCGIFGSIRLI